MFGKRFMDIVGALFALVVSAPLFAVMAVLIKLESPGPVLYRSTRLGLGGRPFIFFKLRTMVDGADQVREQLMHLNECDGPVFKICEDPRITRVGRFSRTTSMSMSAGPRPASGDRTPSRSRTGRRLMYWWKPRRIGMSRPHSET